MPEKGRHPGRPPECPGETMTTVNVSLTTTQRDWLDQEARRRGERVSPFVRRLLDLAMSVSRRKT